MIRADRRIITVSLIFAILNCERDAVQRDIEDIGYRKASTKLVSNQPISDLQDKAVEV